MGASEFSSSTRLKREASTAAPATGQWIPSVRVFKTDQWRRGALPILIGHSDWENYFLGKEGIDRYRIHNLPLKCSCPGLYELGIASSRTNLGRDVRKLDQDRIIVVYLGQADNVRTRLQHYGRAGSHLDHGRSFGHLNADNSLVSLRGPGLFREIFSRGFPLVFRWAPMENKKEAEKTEAQLLGIFDYAWNNVGNGVRRPNDILLKLDKITSSTNQFPSITRKLQQWLLEQPFVGKESGIRIKASSPTKSDTSSDRVNYDFRSRIFKFGRTQPRLISEKCGVKEENAIICGVSLGDGSVCKRKPIQGRKRCEEHKGKRINGFISRPVNEDISVVCGVNLGDGSVCLEVPVHGRKRCELHKGMRISTSNIFPDKERRVSSSNTFFPDRKSQIEENTTVCGVFLSDGSVCKNRPIEGRKRCGEHKGQRVNESIFRSKTEEKSVICGVGLGNGSVCMKVPVHGRKRCELHKGRRVSQ
ncbi:hypothetical protein BVC80_9005g26 [Macleaya cordata]|uniref:GIY-YIG nuclease superfamily n=1 Tax=Macleaya cordata TaxID=56857 RepID=A0A200QLQ3_MACCD|nr:hypothetical protein BVC80_9005g26 [Macleaya cordata]